MSQQVPFDNSGVPLGNDMVAAGYTDASSGYAPQNMGGMDGGGYLPPTQGPHMYARNRAPMIDPIESAKLTSQVLILLILSGLKRHWKWSLPMGVILGLLAAGILYWAFPVQYAASASIQIRSEKQKFLGDDVVQSRYNEFVNTQLALLSSALIVDRALDMPDIAKLPVILKQRDRRAWLQKKLSVKLDGRSEIATVSIATEMDTAAEKIVNAIVDAYLAFVAESARQTETMMLGNLQNERQRLVVGVQQLQNNIRLSTMQAAGQGGVAGQDGMAVGLAQGESLKRDVALEESKLVAMTARRTAARDRIQQPGTLPAALLMQMDPELSQLNTEKNGLLMSRDTTAQSLANPNDDPRIKILDRRIKEIDDKIRNATTDASGDKKQAVMNVFRAQEELNIFMLDQDIRAQEILVKTLRDKYSEQLIENATRSADILDSTFDKTQLVRTNKTLDQIDDRIISIRSEQRAPGQIIPLSKAVPSKPDFKQQIMTVGAGAFVFAFFPLFLSIAVERIKPRLYHVSQVRRSIPQVLIGEIMEPPVSWIHGATFRKRLARYRESVHNWCTHLLLSDPFRSCRTLSIASVAGDDGKTFLAVQIAVAMAQMKGGNVLLIDGDMRVGRLHLLFGNEETGIGLADVLSFRNGFGEAMVQSDKEQNLHLLSAGQLDVAPYELLGDGRFRELLDMLEQNYSLILVVLPPVANAAESLIMASSTDSILLCVRQGETVLAAMEDVYRKLVNTGSSVDGIVVKDIPYYQMAGKDGGFADKLEQIRLSHLLQYAD